MLACPCPAPPSCLLAARLPQVPLKEQLEKDKEDESLRRWKEQLLGSSTSLLDAVGGGDGFD